MIVFRWLSLVLTHDKSALVQVMAWCRQATSHYLSQRWPRSLSPYGVTRPQWVKCILTALRNPTMEMRWSSNHVISTVRIPILMRGHLDGVCPELHCSQVGRTGVTSVLHSGLTYGSRSPLTCIQMIVVSTGVTLALHSLCFEFVL